MNRRRFITATAAAAGSAALASAQQDPVRVAIVGVGSRGTQHVKAFAEIPGAEIGALVDPDGNRAEEAAGWVRQNKGYTPTTTADMRVAFEDGPLAFEARLSCLGEHQARNASLALAAVRRGGFASDAVLADAAPRGLAAARLPARIELLGRDPWLVVDAAHTASSARALARVLSRIPRRGAHLVLSVSAGKDLGAICGALAPLFDQVTVTRAEPVRSLTAHEVAAAVRALAPEARVRVVPNPHLALRAARESLAPGDLLCATGSIYLAGIARRVLAPPSPHAG